MIADAIRVAVPTATNISVDLMSIRWSDPEKGFRYFYTTPYNVRDALLGFDLGKVIPAFAMQLRGGQVTSMRFTENTKEGKKLRQVHKLGKRKLTVSKEQNGAGVTEIVGGKLPPRRLPPHPSHNSLRRFGMKDWSGEYVKGWTEKFEDQDK
jgi:hypothetical protein